MPFHLFKSSLTSFSDVLYFLGYKSYTSFVQFTPKHFILFISFVNGIILFYFILFLDSSLLVYRNTIDFLILILCPATLLTCWLALIVCVCVCVCVSVRIPQNFLYTRSCHLQIEIVLLLLFQSRYLLFLLLAWLPWQ